MIADYDKVITIVENGKLVAVTVQDPVTHAPIHYKVEKMGMDQVKDLLNSENDNNKNIPK